MNERRFIGYNKFLVGFVRVYDIYFKNHLLKLNLSVMYLKTIVFITYSQQFNLKEN